MARSRRNRLRTLVWELQRRRVFRVVGIYVVAAFATLQAADILVPALHLPPWTMTLLVVLALVASPVVIGLAWAFDIVPGGIQRTPDPPPEVSEPGGVALAGSSAGDVAPKLPAIPATPAATPSVAVMPFLNMSADPENEYFADGITEDVIAHLSRIGSLKVISRASVMPFKTRSASLREIGSKLGVSTLLDGSVRRVGERVRIVAELVNPETDQQLWAEIYDRELTDIFSIQTDVALQIARALQAELSPEEQSQLRREPTSNVQAYQTYLQGRHWYIRYTPEGLQRAIAYFTRALQDDPEYALAYVGIAMAYAELAESGGLPSQVARMHATEAAHKALQLDPSSGEAHCAVAHLKSLWEFDWAGAEVEFRRAIELCPNGADAYDLYGRMCAALERYDEALALQRRAQELDPLAHRLDCATTMLRAGRWAEAAAEALRAIEFEPEHDRARATLGWAYFKQGRTEEGLRELQRAAAEAPANTQWFAQLGEMLALAGKVDEARDVLRQMEARAASGFVTPYHFAFVYTGLGEHERALDLLERAFDERGGAIYGLKGSFLFAPLRSHPRFQALLARMNLA